jgi:hypothetical protein
VAKIVGPMLTPLLNWVKEAVTWFHALPQATQENIVKFAAIGGIVLTVGGAFLLVAGHVLSFVAAAAAAGVTLAGIGEAFAAVAGVLAGPVGLAILAVGAALGLLAAAWVNDWGHIREVTAQFVQWVTPYLQTAWTSIVSGAQQLWAEFSGFFQSIWPPIRTVVLLAWTEIRTITVATWTFLSEFLQGTGNDLVAALRGVWDIIVGVVKLAWGAIAGIITIGADLLTGHWNKIWTDLKHYAGMAFDGLLQMFSGFFETIGHLMQAAVTMLTNSGRALMDGLKAGIQSGVSGVQDAVRSMGNDVISVTQNVFQTHSPSQVYHEIGKNVVQGFANGIHEESASKMVNTGYIIPQKLAQGIMQGAPLVKKAVKKTTDDADDELQKWQDHLERQAQNIADVWKKIFDLEHSEGDQKRPVARSATQGEGGAEKRSRSGHEDHVQLRYQRIAVNGRCLQKDDRGPEESG